MHWSFWSVPANLWSADTSIIQCRKTTALPTTVAPACKAVKHYKAARLQAAEANFPKFKLSWKGANHITRHKHRRLFSLEGSLSGFSFFENMPAQVWITEPVCQSFFLRNVSLYREECRGWREAASWLTTQIISQKSFPSRAGVDSSKM